VAGYCKHADEPTGSVATVLGKFRCRQSGTKLFIYERFQVLTAASTMFRIVFWDVLPCKIRTASIIIPDDGGSTHL
jgi:hypothetical protein